MVGVAPPANESTWVVELAPPVNESIWLDAKTGSFSGYQKSLPANLPNCFDFPIDMGLEVASYTGLRSRS